MARLSVESQSAHDAAMMQPNGEGARSADQQGGRRIRGEDASAARSREPGVTERLQERIVKVGLRM